MVNREVDPVLTGEYFDYCGDCDPCIGGRPDQCAIFGKPTIGTHAHTDASPSHVRRAEDAMWRENERTERGRI